MGWYVAAGVYGLASFVFWHLLWHHPRTEAKDRWVAAVWAVIWPGLALFLIAP